MAAFEYNQLTGHLIIPDSVTSIGSSAFYGTSNGLTNKISSITWPNNPNFKTIRENSFIFNKLTSLTFPDSVETIGEAAFAGNANTNRITNITWPNNPNFKSIGHLAFQGNLINTLTLPDSVETIGGAAFQNNQLSIITIPNSVVTIGNGAFSQNRLTNVILGTGVQTMDQGAFSKQSGGGGSFNSNLTSIINPTGRSFDWANITTNSIVTPQVFVTGTITHPNGNITVSAS